MPFYDQDKHRFRFTHRNLSRPLISYRKTRNTCSLIQFQTISTISLDRMVEVSNCMTQLLQENCFRWIGVWDPLHHYRLRHTLVIYTYILCKCARAHIHDSFAYICTIPPVKYSLVNLLSINDIVLNINLSLSIYRMEELASEILFTDTSHQINSPQSAYLIV